MYVKFHHKFIQGKTPLPSKMAIIIIIATLLLGKYSNYSYSYKVQTKVIYIYCLKCKMARVMTFKLIKLNHPELLLEGGCGG